MPSAADGLPVTYAAEAVRMYLHTPPYRAASEIRRTHNPAQLLAIAHLQLYGDELWEYRNIKIAAMTIIAVRHHDAIVMTLMYVDACFVVNRASESHTPSSVQPWAYLKARVVIIREIGELPQHWLVGSSPWAGVGKASNHEERAADADNVEPLPPHATEVPGNDRG